MKTQILSRNWIISIALLLVLSSIVVGCGANPASGSEAQPPQIAITGYGEAKGAPDLASVQLGVTYVDPDLGFALDEANRIIEAVTEGIVSRGVSSSDIQTTNYNIWPEEVFDPQTGMPSGETRYRVDISLGITIRDVERIGELINAGLESGATTVHGISFAIEDPSNLEAEARIAAIADARERAEQLAAGFGMELGDPVSIGEGVGIGYGPVYSIGLKGDLGGGGVGAGAPSSVSPGQSTVGVQVNVVYDLQP